MNSGIQLNAKNSIFSDACLNVGLEPISTSATTQRGEILNMVWKSTLNYTLEQHQWNFATRKEALTLYADSNCDYHLPASYISGVGLGFKDDECCCRAKQHVNFRIVNSRLQLDYIQASDCCDCCCLEKHDAIFYISNDINLEETSATFKKYLSYCLSEILALRYNPENQRLITIQQAKAKYLMEAINLDNNLKNRVKPVNLDNIYRLPFTKCKKGYI